MGICIFDDSKHYFTVIFSLAIVLLLMSASSAAAQPTWGKASDDGFGDTSNEKISSLVTFGDYLYAGTYNIVGCEIWRSKDGTSWELVNNSGFGDVSNEEIYSMVVFDGYLYAGTGKDAAGGEIWRTSNGTSWNQVNEDGFGNSNNHWITSMAVFNGNLYAGTLNYYSGGGIWRTSDGTGWNQVLSNGKNNENNEEITSMTAFNGNLYAGVTNEETGARIWQTSDGEAWSEDVYPYGFGNENNYAIKWLGAFSGPFDSEKLSAGVTNVSSGCQVRERSGGDWTQINNSGFGDENNIATYSFAILNDELYVGTLNGTDGAEIWNYNGSTWTKVNPAGFGTGNNLGVSAMTTFPSSNSRLYAGTGNPDSAAKLWMTPLDTPTLDPMTDPTDTDTFNFEWSEVIGADKYYLQLDDNPEFNSPFDPEPPYSYYNLTADTYDDDNYYWRVSAVDVFGNKTDFSGTDDFTYDTQSPSVPNLLAPGDDDLIVDNTPTFDWEDSTDASSITYRLVVDDDLNFADGENSVDELGLTDSIYALESELPADNYYWKVRAEDELGHQSDWSSIRHFEIYTSTEFNQAPSADFTYSTDGLTVNFTDASSDSDGSIQSWSWNFDDGNTSSEQSPSHSYSSSGEYMVGLEVVDDEGAVDAVSETISVTEGNSSPSADFTYSVENLTVNFTDNSSDPDGSDDLVSWSWDFDGDGTEDNAMQSPSFAYSSEGSYDVTLTVEDSTGSIDEEVKTVLVFEGEDNEQEDNEQVEVKMVKVSGFVENDDEPLEGAIVTIENDNVTTDSDGYYEFDNLEGRSRYDITIEASGLGSYSDEFSVDYENKTLENVDLSEVSSGGVGGGFNVILIGVVVVVVLIVAGAAVYLSEGAES